jgi:predicted glycoside hydrolase/deacetylase ChbG (UPF0249 family)
MPSLTARLGLAPHARVVIVTCDDLGFLHAANVAIYGALRQGVATSASLMVPAPWSRGAVQAYRGEDVGVHLTLNAEHELYRWGPITHAPSLLDGEGGFPRTVEDVWEHADLDEVRHEWRAQIDRSILWGFDVTHLDAHLGGVELKPEFFDAYLELADELRLPVRLPGPEEERRVGFPFRELAVEGASSPRTESCRYRHSPGTRRTSTSSRRGSPRCVPRRHSTRQSCAPPPSTGRHESPTPPCSNPREHSAVSSRRTAWRPSVTGRCGS